jgi:hypothetical protein
MTTQGTKPFQTSLTVESIVIHVSRIYGPSRFIASLLYVRSLAKFSSRLVGSWEPICAFGNLKISCREQEMKSRNHLAIRMMRILLASLSAKHQMVDPSTRESVFNFFSFQGFVTLDPTDTLVRTSYAWPLE